MRRHPPYAPIPDSAKGAAIALGNFDGVHFGHRAVIESARTVAHARSAPSAAAVPEPHPRVLLQPGTPPFRLQTNAQRTRALSALGVDHVFELGFDAAMIQMTDRQFAEQVLAGRFGVIHLSVGENFRFGRKRMGGAAELRAFGDELGFSVEIVPPVLFEGARVSSTAIREALTRGEVDQAARLLGRPWAIEGQVTRGFGRGRDFGFATANVALGDYVRPRLGIYVVRADIGDRLRRPGVASIGANPTVGALPEPQLETHIFDFDAELYGRLIEVELIAFLRDEMRFGDVEALKAQMAVDAAQARAMLSA
jgi:riboflavin kinase/FMN adenylyltransferase